MTMTSEQIISILESIQFGIQVEQAIGLWGRKAINELLQYKLIKIDHTKYGDFFITRWQ